MREPAPQRATRADLEALPENVVGEPIHGVLHVSWLEIGTWSDEDLARIEPFDAVELRLAELWGAEAR